MSEAPLYPLEGVVSWNMNTVCNYRCTYCTQRFLDDRKQWARDVPRFIEAFSKLSGDWEVKLSGGEPFQHPRFDELVRGLASAGRRVSVVTNFSAKDEAIDAFVQATAAKPGVFSASLHLEYADPAVFRARLRRLADQYDGIVVATTVATRSNLPILRDLIADFTRDGLTLRVQPEKQDREVIAYEPHELAEIAELGGHNGTGLVAPDFRGKLCWAGARYFIVDHKGDAWRCYPSRRYRSEALGNILASSFRLRASPSSCSYSYCSCTVPVQRGMVG